MRLPRNSRRIAAALPLVIAWVLAITATASADQTFTVNRLTDDGDGVCDSTCTLRDAVSSANVLPGNDTVVLPAGTLQLSLSGADEDNNNSGDIDIADNTTIRGQGASATTVQSAIGGQRVFDVIGNADVALQDLGVAGGSGVDYGGGIRAADAGQLTLERVAVHDNIVSSDNATFAHGAGIYKGDGSLIVSDSAIYENGSPSLSFYGGGILLETASADIENTTISGNKAKYAGGGIQNDTGNAVTLAFDTITGNSAADGGGIGAGQHDRIRSSIVAGNSGNNCGTIAVQDEGGNVGDAACGLNLPSDALVTDPLLAPLGGTQVPVEEPLAGSPALDRAIGPCPAADARGVPRPQGAACDSGAAERPVAGPPGGGGGGGGTAPHFSIPSKLRVAANLKTIALKLACPASAGKCSGSVKIVGTVAKTSAKKKTRKVTIASGRYSIAGGKSKTLKIKVTKAGRNALRGHRSLSAKLTLRVTDAAGHKGSQSRKVKLTRAKK